MAAVSRRSTQNSHWMWWAYRSSESSRQCHEQHSRLTHGPRQSYHSQHTLNELRAERLSKIYSTVGLYSTTSDLKSVEKSRPHLEHSGGHVTYSHTIANRWNLVGNWVGGRLRQCSCSRGLCIHRYKQWLLQIHMQICKFTTSLDIMIKIVHHNVNLSITLLFMETFHWTLAEAYASTACCWVLSCFWAA